MSHQRGDTRREPVDMPGVYLGRDFWPRIVWLDYEVRFKHSVVQPWGTGASRHEPKPGKYQ